MILTGPLFGILALLSVGAGMVAFAYYQQRECDPIRANYLTNSNQVFVLFPATNERTRNTHEV